MTFCVDNDLTKTQILRALSIDYTCHENNYFLHEISVIFHEPTILRRAQTALSLRLGNSIFIIYMSNFKTI